LTRVSTRSTSGDLRISPAWSVLAHRGIQATTILLLQSSFLEPHEDLLEPHEDLLERDHFREITSKGSERIRMRHASIAARVKVSNIQYRYGIASRVHTVQKERPPMIAWARGE